MSQARCQHADLPQSIAALFGLRCPRCSCARSVHDAFPAKPGRDNSLAGRIGSFLQRSAADLSMFISLGCASAHNTGSWYDTRVHS